MRRYQPYRAHLKEWLSEITVKWSSLNPRLRLFLIHSTIPFNQKQPFVFKFDVLPQDWIKTLTQTPHGGGPQVVKEFNATRSILLCFRSLLPPDHFSFVIQKSPDITRLQTWSTGWSLLMLILQQDVLFMGSREGSRLTTGFSQTLFPRSTP